MNKDIPADCENPGDLLRERQNYSLDGKIYLSKQRIKEWYEYWEGKVYVAFSGGKDSTVLLHLVRSMYPDVPAVFSDTGLEYPEIKEFVRSTKNVKTIRPKMSYRQVIEKYGYAIINKQVSMGFDRLNRTTSDTQKNLRLYGGINPTSGKKQNRSIPLKYHYLQDAPFSISEQCCDRLKKYPFVRYEKQTKQKPYLGIMTVNSNMRQMRYLKQGCNAFDNKKPVSWPMAFWLDKDVWEYIKRFDVSYCKIYDKGLDRTGCMWCMFGVHMEDEPNRFQRMKNTHPKIWDYCINNLGLGDVLDYINVPYE